MKLTKDEQSITIFLNLLTMCAHNKYTIINKLILYSTVILKKI